MTIYRVPRTSAPIDWCDDEEELKTNKPCPEAFIIQIELGWLEADWAWAVDLPDLEALEEFIRTHGKCVLSEHKGTWFIEIYDDWRE